MITDPLTRWLTTLGLSSILNKTPSPTTIGDLSTLTLIESILILSTVIEKSSDIGLNWLFPV